MIPTFSLLLFARENNKMNLRRMTHRKKTKAVSNIQFSSICLMEWKFWSSKIKKL
jgi:hypothetical protein